MDIVTYRAAIAAKKVNLFSPTVQWQICKTNQMSRQILGFWIYSNQLVGVQLQSNQISNQIL